MRAFIFIILLSIFALPAMAENETYICPMHPHISGEQGNSCPICGMTLVTKAAKTPAPQTDAREEPTEHGSVHITPAYVQALGVKTAKVSNHEFGRDIRAFGQIMPSTRLERAIDVRANGWIVDLAVDAVGDTVKKDDLLFTYYSPDLMSAQSDFLIGRRVGNAKQRLLQYGMDDKAITALKKRGTYFDATPFYAPADGTVTTLAARKGAHINAGGNVMMLQDFSRVWINADVPLRDVQFLTVETPATISIPDTGKSYNTTVDFIHPVNDRQSRTVTVRLIVDNPDGTLKPNSYADVRFNAGSQKRLAVPEEAILYGGMGAYVMENISDGYFKPVMVETGISAHGLTEIKSGLSQGQRIVTSGQFMIDAESSLRGGMAAMGDMDMEHINTEDKAPMDMEGMRHE